jgi:hypothetical protein
MWFCIYKSWLYVAEGWSNKWKIMIDVNDFCMICIFHCSVLGTQVPKKYTVVVPGVHNILPTFISVLWRDHFIHIHYSFESCVVTVLAEVLCGFHEFFKQMHS